MEVPRRCAELRRMTGQPKPPGPLGQVLLALGAIDGAELNAALDEQRRTGERIGAILVQRGLDDEQVARALARQLRLPHAAPPLHPEPAALRLVDGAAAARLRAVPLALRERTLRVAMADPLDAAAMDDLRFRTGRHIEPVVASLTAVEGALVAAYHASAVDAVLGRMSAGSAAGSGRPGTVGRIGRASGAGVAGSTGAAGAAAASSVGGAAGAALHANGDGAEAVDSLRRASEAPPVVALVDLILARAVQQRASDVHLEPVGGTLRVRVRVDGVMRELMVLPPQGRGAIVSRIKVMAGLDISVKRRPQDGRSAVRVQGRELALRVSTLPTNSGEKVVLRLLDSGDANQRLGQLGMLPAMHASFARLLLRSHGVLLVTGPTGSGKTTTLYAALSAIDRELHNVITLEDPVEYRLPGLTQVQVHRKAGLGFAAALRAVLRQDPDVIMLGELRDRETVEIALAAALTGHLVLSTLHTNDAASAPARLYEMGAPPYLVAGGLIAVLAQRLARRLCVHCRAQRTAGAAELAALGLPAREAQVFAAVGCQRCDGTGYRGRVGIFELLVVSPRIRERIVRRAPADALREVARAEGMMPLAHDAWLKVHAGLTTIREVAPLLALATTDDALCPACAGPTRPRYHACPSCGALLRRRCSCGARLDDDWAYCPACAAPAAVAALAASAAPAAVAALAASAASAAPAAPPVTAARTPAAAVRPLLRASASTG
jgi:type IV pilus assembly protein PilB